MITKTALASLIYTSAYKMCSPTEPKFKLSSGQESDEYLDIRAMLLDYHGGLALARAVSEVVDLRCCRMVAGVETGGAILARLVGHLLGLPTLCVRKQERNHGTTRHGVDGLPCDTLRRAVWLIEDVITTGSSTLMAIEKLQKIPVLELAGVVCVVDREQGGLEKIKEAVPGIPVLALSTLSAVRAARVE